MRRGNARSGVSLKPADVSDATIRVVSPSVPPRPIPVRIVLPEIPPWSIRNPAMADVVAAFKAIPGSAKDAKCSGSVGASPDGDTHLQGAAVKDGHYLLTHSMKGKKSGRLLVVDRTSRKLVHQYDLPPVEPGFFHAGGCQRIGDCVVVPSESSNDSIVQFFDASDVANIRQIPIALDTPRSRKSGAAGITQLSRKGADVWLLAVHDQGTLDFYEADGLGETFIFKKTFSRPVPDGEAEHQAFQLITDTQNRVFAVGLSIGGQFGRNVAVLYHLDLVNRIIVRVARKSVNPTGVLPFDPRLRWGATIEIAPDALELHCTSHDYLDACHINNFVGKRSPVSLVSTRRRPRVVRAAATRRAMRTAREVVPLSGEPLDLTRGVIVVFSAGGFDAMNPKEVRNRMDEFIADVNADPFVQTATGGSGLAFMLLPGQKTPHLHQTKWRDVCTALNQINPTSIVLVGHSNGGAAAMDLARCLQTQNRQVDLVFSADSVLTLDDIGDINVVPMNVRINVNSYVIPTLAWILAPFPIGEQNRRAEGEPLSGILNIGLAYNLGGARAHRNAFYDLAGGDRKGSGFKYPNLLLNTTLAVLKGATPFDIVQASESPLQVLATRAKTRIEMESAGFKKTLLPTRKR